MLNIDAVGHFRKRAHRLLLSPASDGFTAGADRGGSRRKLSLLGRPRSRPMHRSERCFPVRRFSWESKPRLNHRRAGYLSGIHFTLTPKRPPNVSRTSKT